MCYTQIQRVCFNAALLVLCVCDQVVRVLNEEAGSPKVRSCFCSRSRTSRAQEVKCKHAPTYVHLCLNLGLAPDSAECYMSSNEYAPTFRATGESDKKRKRTPEDKLKSADEDKRKKKEEGKGKDAEVKEPEAKKKKLSKDDSSSGSEDEEAGVPSAPTL